MLIKVLQSLLMTFLRGVESVVYLSQNEKSVDSQARLNHFVLQNSRQTVYIPEGDLSLKFDQRKEKTGKLHSIKRRKMTPQSLSELRSLFEILHEMLLRDSSTP